MENSDNNNNNYSIDQEDNNEKNNIISLDNCDFNNYQNKLNSPRSLEALKRIGVEPNEFIIHL